MLTAHTGRMLGAALFACILFLLTVLMLSTGSLSLPTFLAILGMIVCVAYSSKEGPFAGAVGAVIIIMSAGFLAGLLPSATPVYGVNPSDSVRLAVLVGMTSFGIGVLAFHRRQTLHVGTEAFRQFLSERTVDERVARGLVLVAISVALVNYATGQVPLFAPDINTARFVATDPGLLDRLWPLTLPLLQVGVLLGMMKIIFPRSLRGRTWVLLGAISFVILVMSASRSLAIIPVASAAFLWIEARRPSLLKLAVGALALLSIVGFVGALRTQQQVGDESSAVAGRVADSVALSLQTGPRVWTIAEEVVGPGGTDGALLYSDLANFFNSQVERSDRRVTQIIGRDPTAIGGSPPTVWGGLSLDFGLLGVIVGGFALGAVFSRSRSWLYKARSPSSALWFAYLSAYLVLSTYSYVSLRPSWIIVGLVAVFALRSNNGEPVEDPDGVKVSPLYRRS